MKTKFIVANWKMNPERAMEASDIASSVSKKSKKFTSVKIVICPPYIYLSDVEKSISGSKNTYLGAQDVFVGKGVSHTGEISTQMLKDIGAKYIIVGHSERRGSLDSNEVVREKLFGAIKDGFKVILCVGEKERNDHGHQYEAIKNQIESALIKFPKNLAKNLIIAYEPVWAIGKSEKEAMKPNELHEIVIFIKRVVSDLLGAKNVEKLLILYGGSVTKNNAKEILEGGNADGLLVGRESLHAENFVELIKEIRG
jgi:triosephosphate isomerase